MRCWVYLILGYFQAFEQYGIKITDVRPALPLILDLKMQVSAETQASRSYDAQLLPNVISSNDLSARSRQPKVAQTAAFKNKFLEMVSIITPSWRTCFSFSATGW